MKIYIFVKIYKILERWVLYMDYNKQRKIVKALEAKGKNPLLFLPCLIAKLLVIGFMSACRWVDMALSDSEGNFWRQGVTSAGVPVKRLLLRQRRQKGM